MVTRADQKEIPPLTELAKASFLEIRDYIPSLSLPEVLIIGARPLDRMPRGGDELRYFGRAAREKLKALEKERETILRTVITELYPDESLGRRDVTNHLGKHEFLSSEVAAPLVLLDGLEKGIRTDVLNYRTSIGVYRADNRRIPANIAGLVQQEQTPVHLVFFSHPQYSGSEPHLIGTKRKADIRIAGKIPYKMIDGYRERRRGPEERFKRHMYLEDGVIKDIVGIQFVTLSKKEMAERIKEYLSQSRDIEVLKSREGEEVEDHYAKPESSYHAFHMDVVWNPKADNSGSQLFNPHVDSVEVIMMEFPYFMSSNFGSRGYWRRMIAQEAGIVPPHLKYGRLQADKYTPEEHEWREMVKGRIMAVLGYNNQEHRR
jgi:hypothetical protein